MNNYWYLGVVRENAFVLLRGQESLSGLPSGAPVRLTESAAADPSGQRREIPLVAYEGSAIMVRGIGDAGWICSANVVDRAGPILSHVVGSLFDAIAEDRT